jgi:Purple acid Phosphatase, N-terminal domain
MNRAVGLLAISILGGSLSAQESRSTPKAALVRITQGPKIELAKEHLTIINWTTNNPGGSPVHYGIVHYGTDPNSLIETAKSPIRLNLDHASTVFRVRLDNLEPQTTYYYTVASMDATASDFLQASLSKMPRSNFSLPQHTAPRHFRSRLTTIRPSR